MAIPGMDSNKIMFGRDFKEKAKLKNTIKKYTKHFQGSSVLILRADEENFRETVMV